MRTRRVLFLLCPTAAVAFVVASAAAGAPPGASYPWAQPGTALPVATCTQPPASVPIVPVTAAVPGCSYEWAQPGTLTQLQVSTQPPAWVPIVPAKAGP